MANQVVAPVPAVVAPAPSLWATLDGKKTYILAAVVALYNLVVAFGWVSAHDQATVNLILGSGIVAAIRNAIG